MVNMEQLLLPGIEPAEPPALQGEWWKSSATVEWLTPPDVVQALNRLWGETDLDPCSNPAPYNIPARAHFTAADDGLSLAWGAQDRPSRVYMNPPYARGVIGRWTAKMAAELRQGHISALLALVPARTDTAWFLPLWDAAALCFVRGRLHFIGASDNSATFPSVLAYFGPARQEFSQVFSSFGRVVSPLPLGE